MQQRDGFAWQPTQETIERAQLTRFLAFCGCDAWETFYQRSVTDVAWFTERLLQFLELHGCDFAQGYGIAHPLPLADTIAWLRSATPPPPPPTASTLRAVG